ncbi:MAG: DUF3347 domain-containing protein, partial [Bacteroidota bacterium]|nr:DUF3347 domain-containing protein [Bacteroidota bacterium]
MKKIILGFAVIAITASACNNGSNTTEKNEKKADTTVNNNSSTQSSNNSDKNVDGSMKEMVAQYLQVKNALANDNGKDAATAGKAFVESMGKMDKNSLTGEKKQKWDNISDDAKEMAEHIGDNANKIDHQREHFDMLSTDMYDLVKTFGAGQTLYKDFCPMYNNNKGAIWLSEVKDIKNPYLGKKMPTCGNMKEE